MNATAIVTPLTAAQLDTMLAQEPSSHARTALLRLHSEARQREAARTLRKASSRRRTWSELATIFAPLAILAAGRIALAVLVGI